MMSKVAISFWLLVLHRVGKDADGPRSAERKQNVEFGNRIHRTLLEMWSDQKKELLKIVLNAGLLALAHVPLHL